MKLPFTTPIVIDSNLGAADCISRLSEAIISPFSFFELRSVHPVAGRVRGNTAVLRYRTFYSNSFQRLLRLTVEPTDTGCRLQGEFSMSKATYVFGVVWFGVLFLSALAFLFSLALGKMKFEGKSDDLLFLIPFALPVFGYALLRFGLWLSHRTEERLIEFVEHTVIGQAPRSNK